MLNGVDHGPRLYVEADLGGAHVELDERRSHYAGRVLRLQPGEPLIVFNGKGDERRAIIEKTGRGGTRLKLHERLRPLPNSSLAVTLIQACVKNDAMDLIVQKATELGVESIRAVETEFSVVRIDAGRGARRLEHWRRIATSACEQSGRHFPPTFDRFASLEDCLASLPENALRIVFRPDGEADLASLGPPKSGVCLLVGPEGGWSRADLTAIAAARFASVRCGPRVLRSETAAIAACVLAQWHWGDLRPA